MPASPFFKACGGREALRFAAAERERAVLSPVVLIGSSSRADIPLPAGPAFALAMILVEGRLFAVPLSKEEAIFRNDEIAKNDWVNPDDRFQIGDTEVRVLNPHQPGSDEPDFDPLSNDGARESDLRFEPVTSSRQRKSLSIIPRLTLVGRAEPARFKINYDGVEPVHAAILRTNEGPWLVDLTRRDLTLLNDGPITAARLRNDDIVTLGSVELIAKVAEAKSLAVPVDTALGPILNQVAQFQQQTFDQFREMLGSMTQMFGAVLQEHRQFVKEEFARIERSQGTALPAVTPPPPPLKAAEPKPAAPVIPPESVTPISAGGVGFSAPPPNTELHAWLHAQVENLEKAQTSRWKRLVERFKKK